jgi:hypothetical protein
MGLQPWTRQDVTTRYNWKVKAFSRSIRAPYQHYSFHAASDSEMLYRRTAQSIGQNHIAYLALPTLDNAADLSEEGLYQAHRYLCIS